MIIGSYFRTTHFQIAIHAVFGSRSIYGANIANAKTMTKGKGSTISYYGRVATRQLYTSPLKTIFQDVV